MISGPKYAIDKWLAVLGVCISAILAQTTFAQQSPGFQSFEEFQRSRDKSPGIQVRASTIPGEVHSGGFFKLRVTVIIDPGGHIYSIEEQIPEESLATQLRLDRNAFLPQAEWSESAPRIAVDGVFQKAVKIHENTVEFHREFKVLEEIRAGIYLIAGALVYRFCDDKTCSLAKELAFQTSVLITESQRVDAGP